MREASRDMIYIYAVALVVKRFAVELMGPPPTHVISSMCGVYIDQHDSCSSRVLLISVCYNIYGRRFLSLWWKCHACNHHKEAHLVQSSLLQQYIKIGRDRKYNTGSGHTHPAAVFWYNTSVWQ